MSALWSSCDHCTLCSVKRKYELKARAEKQAETRRRITEATVALHEEVGPARTTVAEVARRAGVTRLTVYNNFPEERELFAACQGHWIERHPPPALDPAEGARGGAARAYGWYRETARMAENVRRDRALVPELDALMRETARRADGRARRGARRRPDGRAGARLLDLAAPGGGGPLRRAIRVADGSRCETFLSGRSAVRDGGAGVGAGRRRRRRASRSPPACGRGRWASSWARSTSSAAARRCARDRGGQAALDDPVRAAGHGEDDAGPAARRERAGRVRGGVGRQRRARGGPRRDRPGAAPAPDERRAHDLLPRRDPSLQQGAAGHAAARRSRTASSCSWARRPRTRTSR